MIKLFKKFITNKKLEPFGGGLLLGAFVGKAVTSSAEISLISQLLHLQSGVFQLDIFSQNTLVVVLIE